MNTQVMVRYIKTAMVVWVIVSAFAWGAQPARPAESAPAGTAAEPPAACPATESKAAPTKQPDLFDPAHHIDVNEITAGMKGYGLTVFHGTKIEPFDVEVVSVVHNTQPGRDTILIRCLDDRFQKAKVVQGVSGSPVYLNGKMAGAMAFGWAMSEEPLYGVTPIRQMLQIQRSFAGDSAAATAAGDVALPRRLYRDLLRDVLIDDQLWKQLVQRSGLAADAANAETGSAFMPLPLPMTLTGFSPKTIQSVQQRIPTLNVLLAGPAVGTDNSPAGAAGTISTAAESRNAESTLAPGGVMTIPLITGDFEGSILGTVTEVIGNQVYGFGHPWNARGPGSWPLAAGTIHTFINRTTLSFKLGQAGPVIGAVLADETSGVFGRIGDTPDMIPVNITIEWPYADSKRDFNLKIARDEKINPFLLGLITQEAFQYKGAVPTEHTIRYRVELSFDKVEPIRFENVSTGEDLMGVFDDLVSPLMLLLENPWQKIQLTGVKISADVLNRETSAVMKSARIDRQYYKPGQTVVVQIELEPVRSAPKTCIVQLPLPDDLPEGRYQIQIGSSEVYVSQLRQTQPHLFQAFNAADVRNILQQRLDIARNNLYICMALPENGGLAVENQAFPQLPSGKSMLINDKTRKKNSASFRPMIYQSVPIDYVPSGSETFDITVQRTLN